MDGEGDVSHSVPVSDKCHEEKEEQDRSALGTLGNVAVPCAP